MLPILVHNLYAGGHFLSLAFFSEVHIGPTMGYTMDIAPRFFSGQRAALK